jgi:mannose-1-phosphate guanylyltransferase
MGKTHNYVVILAGGGGSRLWPKSRAKKPKQFLKLIDEKTLFQHAYEGISQAFPKANIFVVTSEGFVEEIRSQTPSLAEENILVEPIPRSTTAAAGFAAKIIYQRDKHAVISTLASDHYIKEKTKFLKILSVCQKAALQGDNIVTIGIVPTHPHIGMGYIRVDGEAFSLEGTTVFKIRGFKEKPDQTTAAAYFASGEYFWNANMNTYKATTILNSIKNFTPKLYKALDLIGKDGAGRNELAAAWQELESVPIDIAILEKAKNVLMVPGDFSWFDIGDWTTIHTLLSKREYWNVLMGSGFDHVGLDTEGCLIHGNNRLVATLGIKDLIVVDTDDVLFVSHKSRSQDMKDLIQVIKKAKKESYL